MFLPGFKYLVGTGMALSTSGLATVWPNPSMERTLDRRSQMRSGIHISRVWSDDDVVELRILVADGTSSFSNKAYVGHAALEYAVSSLHVFKDHVHGGLFDLRFGEFGSEYASGAFHARFHFYHRVSQREATGSV